MTVEKHHSACALNCPDVCSFIVHVENERITRIEGNKDHPYTLRRCCPKGYAHILRMYSKDRLLYPMKKMPDNTFKRISWKSALDEIAAKMQQARNTYGPESVAIYSGSGNDGMAPRYAARFSNAFGCRMIPGIAEICFEGAYEGLRFNVGPFEPHELSDWSNSRCIVIWGTNRHESSSHSKRVIQQAINQGAKLIVIDPRKTPYAKIADLYTTIRPGSDGALALGIANEIIRKGLFNRDFVDKYVLGFEEYRLAVSEYTKKRVSAITWVSEDMIEKIAKTFANHGPALIITAPAGMNHYTNGTWAARAVHSLLAICGYLGISGGGFQYLSSDCSPFNGAAVSLSNLLDDDVQPIVPSGTYIPDYVLSKQESPIKVIVIQAANPITQWPNTQKATRALQRIPLKIAIDLEMTDTARICDIVLPATFIFEHHNLAYSELHRIVQYAPKIVKPLGEARTELDIWRDIAERIGIGSYFQLSEIEAIQLLLNSNDCRDITLEKLREKPEGIRTASPGIPFSEHKFNTPSGKVELYSSEVARYGYNPLPFHEEPEESPISKPSTFKDYPLIMITGRLRTRLHSQYTTVQVGATVKNFAQCTSCKKCITECPDEAISLIQPSPQSLQRESELAPKIRAGIRYELSVVVSNLAVNLTNKKINIPEEMTVLLLPKWDSTRCIGCRECQIDVCPFDVVTDPIQMPAMDELDRYRTFLHMHPMTAAELGLLDGERVRVESLRGHIDNVRLELTEDIDPRVVWTSDGWWNRDGNINLLSDDKHSAFGHTPGFNSILVRVKRIEKQII